VRTGTVPLQIYRRPYHPFGSGYTNQKLDLEAIVLTIRKHKDMRRWGKFGMGGGQKMRRNKERATPGDWGGKGCHVFTRLLVGLCWLASDQFVTCKQDRNVDTMRVLFYTITHFVSLQAAFVWCGEITKGMVWKLFDGMPVSSFYRTPLSMVKFLKSNATSISNLYRAAASSSSFGVILPYRKPSPPPRSYYTLVDLGKLSPPTCLTPPK